MSYDNVDVWIVFIRTFSLKIASDGFRPAENALPPLMAAAAISGKMLKSTPDSASRISIFTLYLVISALVGT